MRRLHTQTLRIETLETTGEMPGWIYAHRAVLVSPHEIRVGSGTLVTKHDGREDNLDAFVLDVNARARRRAEREPR